MERRKFDNFREVEKVAPITEKKNSSRKISREEEKNKKKLKNRIGKLELNIEQFEKEIKVFDSLIAGKDASITQLDFFKTYQDKKDKLEKMMHEWTNLQEQLME